MKYSLIGLWLIGFFALADNAAPQLKQQWVLSGLENPESVILSPDGSYLLVSNVNGGGSDKDGNGYIATVSLAGELLEKHWVTGLNGPKGMGQKDGNLFVADIDQVVVIDIAEAEIIHRVKVSGAGFLNDVAIDTDNTVLVSDSANARIYSISTNYQASTWMENERFGGINGLHPRSDDILITTMSDGELLRLQRADKTLSVLANGMSNADGIAQIQQGYLISSWPGQLHYVGLDGTTDVILDTTEKTHYMNDIFLHGDLLLIPNWEPGSLTAYTVGQ